MKQTILLFLTSFMMVNVSAQTPAKRMLAPNDVLRMKQVRQPKVSPEGNWILYTVSRVDSAKDKNLGKLLMTSWDGKETVALTEQTTNPGAHAWSPDGKYISYLAMAKSDAPNNSSRQLYVMDRRGGEPVQLTHFKESIISYHWSPKGNKIVFVLEDPDVSDTAKSNVRKPFEITRYRFKQDYQGYLDDRKSHLYLFDVTTKKVDTLTSGNFDESTAVFSHDGNSIAYVSNTSAEPDRNSNSDIFVYDLKARKSRRITSFKGSNGSPAFSPDDRMIAYTQSLTEDNYNMYDVTELVIKQLDNGKEENLSKALDRSIRGFVWAADGKSVYALVEDDRKQHIYQLGIGNGSSKIITKGNAVYQSIQSNDAGKMVALYSNPQTPEEVYVFDGLQPRRLTHVQDEFLSNLKLAHVKGFTSISADKTEVSGILYTPDSTAKKLPLVLFIHGGPVAQDDYSFDESRQILTSAGFAVAAVNYRGSSGRGAAFSRAIYADWGNKEVIDIIGVANHLIKIGVADSTKLAIGGWSYGGILTNYTIAKDNRFKAAVSGAGSSLQMTMYGTDQYVTQYDEELGTPWKNPQKWLDLSYPFFKVANIKTPTLFMASQNDFNVPVAGAEQMYQALKHEGISTELIIYPGQNHGVSVPSYIIHRYERHINWFKKFLK
ncbi:MAG: prolyl oligopeptidase family serine peptidase [Chitinophagaceae bacterium]